MGRTPGEWIDYPLQYFGAPLVAQTVENLPAMQETQVRSLGWEYAPKKGMATHSSILAWRESLWTQATVHGVAELATTEQLSTEHSNP